MQRSSSNEALSARKSPGDNRLAVEIKPAELRRATGEVRASVSEVKRRALESEKKHSSRLEDPAAEEVRRRARDKEAEMIKQREALEQQKERERKERERQMLRNLEAEEKRRQAKREEEREREAEMRRQLAEEEARRKSLEADMELERKRTALFKRELELRRNYPYAVRATTFSKRPFEDMHTFLPLLRRSVSTSTNTSSYFLDLQVSLVLGFFNIHKVCK
jgi:flagellar biosynthesis GTPase FlhF